MEWSKYNTQYNLQQLLEIPNLFDVNLVAVISKMNRKDFVKHIFSDKIVYICISESKNLILKVGQTTVWKKRMCKYNYRDEKYIPITYFLYTTNSWKEQDIFEKEIRIYLDSLGHLMPWDNTGSRLYKMNYPNIPKPV